MPALADARRTRARRKATSLLLVIVALLSWPDIAAAGGMEVGDNGGEAMGRGGAFVAKADTPAAVNYNPAGFAKLRGHQIAVTANALHSIMGFQRSGERFPTSNEPGGAFSLVSNAKPWFVMPMHLVVTTDFGYFDRLTFAAGFYGPSVASHEFSPTVGVQGQETAAPQRFDMVSTGGLIMFPSIGVAYRVHPMLDIGVTFQGAITKVQSKTLATVSAACTRPEDPACDVLLDVDVHNWFAPTGSFGFLLRPSRNLEVGSLLRFPSKAELSGNAKVSFGSKVKELEGHFQYKMLDPEEPRISLTNSYPWMFRLGARYVWWRGGAEAADIEVDFTYEAWSQVSKRSVQIEATSLNKPLAPLDMDWKLADTYGVRAGGAYNFRLGRDLRLTLRAGGFGETQATSVSNTNLQVFSSPKLAMTAGLGLKWRGLSLDLAYAHVFLSERKVQQSTVRAADFGGGQGPVVGNGVYTASVDGLYLQLTASYGAGRLAAARSNGDAEPLAHAGGSKERAASASSGSKPRFDPDAVVYEGERSASSEAEISFAGDEVTLPGQTAMEFAGNRVKLSRKKMVHRVLRAGRVREKVVKHCPKRDRQGRCLRPARRGVVHLGMR